MDKVSEADVAWLAGIIDGEGCFACKRPIARKSGPRSGYKTCYQLWLVLCNTSERMILRARDIILGLGVQPPRIRKTYKGKRATRWQYTMCLTRKHDLLLLTEAVLPHLTAKRLEAEITAWFLRKACLVPNYRTDDLDRAVLRTMGAIKRNGGEAPAESIRLLCEVIPSQAVEGYGSTEGVEIRAPSPNGNEPHERPATLSLVRSG